MEDQFKKLDERLHAIKEVGGRPTLADCGIKIDALEKHQAVDTLSRIGADMMKAVDDMTLAYLAKFFPQLTGKTREEAHDWLVRKKVFYSPIKREKAIEGGSVLFIAFISLRFKVRRCVEVRCQVLTDLDKPGKVALKIAHKEVPFPEEFFAVENRVAKETL